MPSTYAHYTFGERMLLLFPAKIRALIQENRALYDIGLHGPDILFYYKALCSNEVNAVGYEMHDKPGADFFAPAKEIWQQFRTDGASCAQHTAYLLGFLCHYALDQCCHGYVEKMMAVSGLSHAEIETEFDWFLLLQAGKDPLRAHLTQHIHPTRDRARVIADFFPTLTTEQIFQALCSMIRYHKLLRTPGTLKRSFLLGILKISGNYADMHGLLMRKNSNPACQLSNNGLSRRLGQALHECQSLTQEYLDCLEKNTPLSTHFMPTFGAGDSWQHISLES